MQADPTKIPPNIDLPPKMGVAVDVALFTLLAGKLSILLIERKFPPYQSRWALPGGFVENNEELDSAAARELHEETGLTNVSLEQWRTYATIGRDPRGRTLAVVYLAFAPYDMLTIRAGDDAAAAKLHPFTALPALAFDHNQILHDCRLTLQSWIQHASLWASKMQLLSQLDPNFVVELQKEIQKLK